MALERVAVLEEELELSNQEVGAWQRRGGARSRWRTTTGPLSRNSVCSGVLALLDSEPSRSII